jgi:protein-L-isoaspartate(D-aspartate) O-methyltransferase
MNSLPRERFVPLEQRERVGEDSALPIGCGQTISQPSLVAWMTELLEIRPGDRILEIGTGSGYQAAVLARLGAEVRSIEVVRELHDRARALLDELGIDAELRLGDGHAGWPDAAPFDAIILTCATPMIPLELWDQLAAGGRLVAPIGAPDGPQWLVRWRKGAGGERAEELVTPVRFVPMTRE